MTLPVNARQQNLPPRKTSALLSLLLKKKRTGTPRHWENVVAVATFRSWRSSRACPCMAPGRLEQCAPRASFQLLFRPFASRLNPYDLICIVISKVGRTVPVSRHVAPAQPEASPYLLAFTLCASPPPAHKDNTIGQDSPKLN